tara:strand:+ start:850 stop:996 length:147 start_codon:yes stop_codon:yes gene_type:complete
MTLVRVFFTAGLISFRTNGVERAADAAMKLIEVVVVTCAVVGSAFTTC